MNVVYCIDAKVLPGVCASVYSVLRRSGLSEDPIQFWILSDTVRKRDLEHLEGALRLLEKPFELHVRAIESSSLQECRTLNASVGAYFRLFAPLVLDVDRLLYLDSDTVCDLDVQELERIDLGGSPAGWVPEAPLSRAVDRRVAEELGNSEREPYFNSGVMLMNVREWRRQNITEKVLNYVRERNPDFHDQSGLNVVLYGNSRVIDERFNCMANMRRNWGYLKRGHGKMNRIVHFIDYPKPWDFLGRWVHPQFELWERVHRDIPGTGAGNWNWRVLRDILSDRKRRAGYMKAIKDRALFRAYARRCAKVRGVE